jgi:1-deoxy-D-xylulose-5-phosphate synthase
MVQNSLKAAELLHIEGIEAEVVNMRFIKPIDEAMLKSLSKRIKIFMTIEDNVIHGGFGSGVLETFSKLDINDAHVKVHGLPDEFIEHGTPAELHRLVRIDAAGIAETAKNFLENIKHKSMV